MVRTVIALAACVVALPAFAAGPSTAVHRNDDSFLYAAPAQGGQRVPNYVADLHRGQPLDHNDRRKFERPSLSGEAPGLKLQQR